MSGPVRTVRVQHRLDLDTIAKILLGCELLAHPRHRDVRHTVTASLAEHSRVGALHRLDLQRREATATRHAQQHRQRLAVCRHLAEQCFPARPPRQGRPLIEALYESDNQ